MALQWKMSFNPDVLKQAQEVIFCKKPQKVFHPTVLFNNIPVQHGTVQKHLGVYIMFTPSPPFLLGKEKGVEPPTKFSKRGVLKGPHLLEGGC